VKEIHIVLFVPYLGQCQTEFVAASSSCLAQIYKIRAGLAAE